MSNQAATWRTRGPQSPPSERRRPTRLPMTIGAQGCLARPYPAQDRYRNVVVLVVVPVGFTAFTLEATKGRHTLFLNTQHHWMVNNNLARIFPMDTDDGHVGWPVMGCVPQRTRPCKCCQLVLSPLFWTSSDPFTFCNATTSSILPLLWMDVRCYF